MAGSRWLDNKFSDDFLKLNVTVFIVLKYMYNMFHANRSNIKDLYKAHTHRKWPFIYTDIKTFLQKNIQQRRFHQTPFSLTQVLSSRLKIPICIIYTEKRVNFESYY